ncbi:cysteine hydrolase [Vibrio cholerae]|nr:cysteine hydrolase [Vibrio cholerae]EMA2408528.1 cysteine hydrolase [Vibrio cholerae]
MNSSALIIIDIQNDYFPNGLYPQWQAEQVLDNTLQAVDIAQRHQMPIILVQHIADPKLGSAPFFNTNTEGAELHPKLVAAVPEGIVVVKAHADSFLNTDLAEYLQRFGVRQLYLCGMMTQNCVTHTALSPQAAPYQVRVLPQTCSSVDAMVHGIALHALSDRVAMLNLDDFATEVAVR